MSQFPHKLDHLPLIPDTPSGSPGLPIPADLVQRLNTAVLAVEAHLGFSLATGGDVRVDGTIVPPPSPAASGYVTGQAGSTRILLVLSGIHTVTTDESGSYGFVSEIGLLFEEAGTNSANPIPTATLPTSLGASPSPLMRTQSPVLVRALRRSRTQDPVCCGIFPNPHGQAVLSVSVQPGTANTLVSGETFDFKLFFYGGA